jgi:shikimate dehydrogenase
MPTEVDGSTRLFVIIGDPISAVRSPQAFNELFAQAGANAIMIPLRVPAEELAVAWAGLKAMPNIEGVVITMPHKVAMAALVDDLGPGARVVGAINATRRGADGRWTGDMFDGRGCVNGLLAQGHVVAGRRVFLLGAGGAGAAIAAALAEARVATLVIDDLDAARRDAVIAKVAHAYPGAQVRAGSLAPGDFDIVINATPLGMRPADPLPFDPATLPASTLVVDVVPKPEVTRLLERAQATGHAIQPGKHMHRGQVRDIARFFGFDVEP